MREREKTRDSNKRAREQIRKLVRVDRLESREIMPVNKENRATEEKKVGKSMRE